MSRLGVIAAATVAAVVVLNARKAARFAAGGTWQDITYDPSGRVFP